MKIVIAGGTGFIGQELVLHFLNQGQDVYVLSRSKRTPLGSEKYLIWDGEKLGSWVNDLKNTDVLINLAGKSVDCRYNDTSKKEILHSRLNSVKVLETAFKEIKESPKVWINSSTATIYRHETEKPNDEYSDAIGKGFSVNVAKKWEKAVDNVDLNCRKIKLRIAIVLGNSGGAFITYKKMTQYGFGGKHGDGNQMFSWIHIKDLNKIVDFTIINTEIEGVINCAAPNPINNKTFMKKLRNQIGISFGLPATKWMLKIGAFMLGTETELLLKSRWVVSKRLKEEGFMFEYSKIDEALYNLLKNRVPKFN